MTIYIKAQQIKLLTKKHSSWCKVFLAWLEYDHDLSIEYIELSFKILLKNKALLSNDINVNFAMQLLKDKNNNDQSLSELFYDKIQEALHFNRKNNFIKSLKTEKYKDLFNNEIEEEIHIILDNKISILVLNNQFFIKLASYKNSKDLLNGLIQFKEKNIEWSKKYYLNRIKNENLNIQELKSIGNTLLIHVNDYHSCSRIGSQTWCIVQKKMFWNHYVGKLDRQIIYMDFDKPINDNESIIGFTVKINGEIGYSHLKDDLKTPSPTLLKFNFQKRDKKEIENYLSFFSNQDAFYEICNIGLLDFYHQYRNKEGVNPLLDNNKAIGVAVMKGHTEIVTKILSEKKYYPFMNILYILWSGKSLPIACAHRTAFIYACTSNKTGILKMLLQRKIRISEYLCNTMLSDAIIYRHTQLVDILIRDKNIANNIRVNRFYKVLNSDKINILKNNQSVFTKICNLIDTILTYKIF